MIGLGSDKKEKQLFLSKVSQLQWHYSQRFAECCPRSFSTWLAISSTTPSRRRCRTASGLTSWRSRRTSSRSWRWRRTTTAPWTIHQIDNARHRMFFLNASNCWQAWIHQGGIRLHLEWLPPQNVLHKTRLSRPLVLQTRYIGPITLHDNGQSLLEQLMR